MLARAHHNQLVENTRKELKLGDGDLENNNSLKIKMTEWAISAISVINSATAQD